MSTETPPLDWETVPPGEIYEWRHPNPGAHTHIVCNQVTGEVYFREIGTGEWSYGGPNAGRMTFHLRMGAANWRQLDRPATGGVKKVRNPMAALDRRADGVERGL